MTTETRIFGCRSAIQKAIRRGNPALAKMCFDELWKIPDHQKWLTWRLPAIMAEECWYMAADFHEIWQMAKEATAEYERKRLWLKIVIRMAITIKNQDASGLANYVRFYRSGDMEHPEMSVAKEIGRIINTKYERRLEKVPTNKLDELLQSIAGRKPTDYEKRAFAIANWKRYAGGLIEDRWMTIATMILTLMRGLEEPKVNEVIIAQRAVFKDTPLPSVVPLPWYVFDMHTRAGRLARAVYLKKENDVAISGEDLDAVWFCCESALVGKLVSPQFKRFEDTPKPTITESIWWPPRRIAKFSYGGAMRLWKESIRGKMRDLVKWAVTK